MIIISGAMVASLALPASALTPAMAMAPVGVAVSVSAPLPAEAPLTPRTFGTIGFTGVVKPQPVVVPVARPVAVAVSRSTTRTAISPAATPAPRSGGVLGIAASLAGIYYVYGGTTTAGFDCSGFTQYVFAKVGINLPRTSQEQQQAATSVSNPQPGDLVFFGSPAGHVGIYAGNGMMWDSPHSGQSVGLHAVYSGASYGRP